MGTANQKMMEKTCLRCGCTFNTVSPLSRYCSASCRVTEWKENNRDRHRAHERKYWTSDKGRAAARRATRKFFPCCVCGQTIERDVAATSPTCDQCRADKLRIRKEATAKRRREERAIWSNATCVWCGRAFTRCHPLNVCCSDACRKLRTNAINRERNRERYANDPAFR